MSGNVFALGRCRQRVANFRKAASLFRKVSVKGKSCGGIPNVLPVCPRRPVAASYRYGLVLNQGGNSPFRRRPGSVGYGLVLKALEGRRLCVNYSFQRNALGGPSRRVLGFYGPLPFSIYVNRRAARVFCRQGYRDHNLLGVVVALLVFVLRRFVVKAVFALGHGFVACGGGRRGRVVPFLRGHFNVGGVYLVGIRRFIVKRYLVANHVAGVVIAGVRRLACHRYRRNFKVIGQVLALDGRAQVAHRVGSDKPKEFSSSLLHADFLLPRALAGHLAQVRDFCPSAARVGRYSHLVIAGHACFARHEFFGVQKRVAVACACRSGVLNFIVISSGGVFFVGGAGRPNHARRSSLVAGRPPHSVRVGAAKVVPVSRERYAGSLAVVAGEVFGHQLAVLAGRGD